MGEGGQEIQTFAVDAKPNIGLIQDYFTSRLHGTEQGISGSTDALGNSVFTSNGKQEATLHEPHPATLVVSAAGKELIGRNRGLLHQIASGKIEAEEIGEGQEGKVYKIELDTPEGKKPFALKYTFPISRPPMDANDFQADDLFTPGVDQMRLMQLLQREAPSPGLQVAAPVLATLDMTLAPYVENTISLKALQEFFFSRRVNREEIPLESKDRKMLVDIDEQDKLGKDSSERFKLLFMGSTVSATEGLGEWLRQVDFASLSIIMRNYSSAEVTNSTNLLISLDSLRSLYEQFGRREGAFVPPIDFESSELQIAVNKCCTLIELTVGSKPKEEAPGNT